MNKKRFFIKLAAVIVCIAAAALFAISESGVTPAFLTAYKNNFKRNINGICQFLHIDLSVGTQLYLDDMSAPEPKPQMTPASEEDLAREELKYPGFEEEAIEPKEGDGEFTIKEEPKPVIDTQTAFPAAENTCFEGFRGGVICANETLYARYDGGAKLLWEEKLQMQEPILALAGDYVLVSETGAKKLSLYKGRKLMFSAETDGNIYTADLSERGDVVAVTQKEYYKGQVTVFNKRGDRIFVWDSGSYSIMDAAVSYGRKVAVALLNTDEGASSIIQVFDVEGNELCKTEDFINTVFFRADFDGEDISLLSESMCMCMTAKGKIKWEYGFDGRRLKMCRRAKNGDRAVLLDNGGIGEIVVITSGGKAYPALKTENMPDTIDIRSRYVAYNNGRNAMLVSYNGKKRLTAECAGDIKKIYITGRDKVFCVYSAAVQEKTLRKLPKAAEEQE